MGGWEIRNGGGGEGRGAVKERKSPYSLPYAKPKKKKKKKNPFTFPERRRDQSIMLEQRE